MVAVPEFLVHFEERQVDGLAVLLQEVDVLPGIALLHGRGEVDVELQLVFGDQAG